MEKLLLPVLGVLEMGFRDDKVGVLSINIDPTDLNVMVLSDRNFTNVLETTSQSLSICYSIDS